MVRKNNRLYDQLLLITSDYLGPATHRFIDRQIQYHLDKPPENITPRDLELLIDWIRTSIAHLTEDQRIRREYNERLKALLGAEGAERRD